MVQRRKKINQQLKSIWDEKEVKEVFEKYNAGLKNMYKIYNWLISHTVERIEDIPMTLWSIPKNVIKELTSNFHLFICQIRNKEISIRGDTIKLLIELQDGHRIETVIIEHRGHTTVCVSSQVGCQMGCKFCATGTMGIIGDLTSAEIIEQVVYANQISKIRNIVFMGMGEPLQNFENLKLSIECFIDTKRFGLSPRHITVSTVGVLKNMYRLTDELGHVNLALSLHAPNQEVRLQIVPTANLNPIEKLMEAIDYHIVKHSRNGKNKTIKVTSVMIEYILIRDVNDRDEHAHELCQLLLSRRQHILLNLIPYNPTDIPGQSFQPPTQQQIDRFYQICTSDEYKIFSRVRQEMGQDISGACGQLALKSTNNESITHEVNDIEDLFSKKKVLRKSTTNSTTKSSTTTTTSISVTSSSTLPSSLKQDKLVPWLYRNIFHLDSVPFLSNFITPFNLFLSFTVVTMARKLIFDRGG